MKKTTLLSFMVILFAALFNQQATGQSTHQSLFASSNTQAIIGVLDITIKSDISNAGFGAAMEDADGVFYDPITDVLYQVNRSDNRVDMYSDVLSSLNNGMTPTLAASSPSGEFVNGRELAVYQNKIVVAQDASEGNNMENALVVFMIEDGQISLDKKINVDINLWGIHADGNDLYAIVDNSNMLAVFEDFFDANAGTLVPTNTVNVMNLVRTHGLTYDAASDYMILTDIGDAGSASDGFIVAIKNFTSASADGIIDPTEQVRVGGGSSQLGNPVDVAYNSNDGVIYIAERANEGGKILGFVMPALSGGIAPLYSLPFAGASAVHAHRSFSELCETVSGGTVALEEGGTETTIFIDGQDDFLSFSSSIENTLNTPFTYVVTDANGSILGIPPGNMVNFEPAGLGICKVYGLSYTGSLNISMGDDLFSGEELSNGCFVLSSNSISVNRIESQDPSAQLFASSNNSGQITNLNIYPDGSSMSMFSSADADADGIYYDKDTDRLFQLNRTSNVVDVYIDVNQTLLAGNTPTVAFSSTSDFINGREIAVTGNKLVVAQDANDDNGQMNVLYVYNIGMNALTLENTYNVSINLWGIHADARTLFAIVDNSNELAVFDEFFDNVDGEIVPTQTIAVENLVRTHGLTYNSKRDMMILTDIGDAGSATDGALVVIKKFSSKIDDDMISTGEQIRVYGGASMLGNPVDVAFDDNGNKIWVAERATNGGMILQFNNPSVTSAIAPRFTKPVAGASAVHIFGGQNDFCNFLIKGTVTLESGETETTIFVDDEDDVLSFNTTVPVSDDNEFTYVVTDGMGSVLGVPPSNMNEFNGAGLGACRVWGLSYTGDLLVTMGTQLFQDPLSTECASLSTNSILVNRIAPQDPNDRIFVSSNNSGSVGVISVFDNDVTKLDLFDSDGMDADGIFYDQANDRLFQLNRSNSVVDVYTGVAAALNNGTIPTLVGSSTSDFTNGRAIAVAGDKLVVANDVTDANTLVTYDIGTDNSLTLNKINTVDFNLWGIHLNGSNLFAIADNSNNVALIKNFFNKPAGDVMIEHFFEVENLVRTHGITFVPERDMLILTDIGDAGSASDGALVVIKRFSTKFMDDEFISSDEQIRVSGLNSRLGNPVDVDFDLATNTVYVAERAVDGGLILGFVNPAASGGIAPIYVRNFAGASAIDVPADGGDLCNFVVGGTVALQSGETETTIFVDNEDDVLTFSSTAPISTEYEFTYVVTDGMGSVLGVPPSNMNEFNGAGLGACRVWGLSYTGDLLVTMGTQLFQDPLSTECSDLSSNSILVNRIAPQGPNDRIFVSSNNSGSVGVVSVFDNDVTKLDLFDSDGMDADGIFYDQANDRLFQLNRSNSVVDVYTGVAAALSNGTMPPLAGSSTSDFTNGRAIAVAGDKLVVANDVTDANTLVTYDIGMDNSLTLNKINTVDFNLWGIHLNGSILFAIADNSNNVALIKNFFNKPDGDIMIEHFFEVENLGRTHGITFVPENDMLILTDIGDAGSANDGALVVIKKFSTTFMDDEFISSDEQIKVSGPTSRLGNPVDVDFDQATNTIYVAERAVEGGLILGFDNPALSGGIAPRYVRNFAGASAIDVPAEGGDPCNFLATGTVAFDFGGTETTIFIDDVDDFISFESTIEGTSDFEFTYVVTDGMGKILGIPEGNTVNFEPAGLGNCKVYGLSYSGSLLIDNMTNDMLFEDQISDGCSQLSSNSLLIKRIAPIEFEGQVYVSSNTTGNIGIANIIDAQSATMEMFSSQDLDADGIYYNEEAGMLYQLNRTNNVIDVYTDVPTNPTYLMSSSSDFSNGREITLIDNNYLVVAQDANDANNNENRLIVYDISNGDITLEESYDVDINLWGIDGIGSDLYAIVDNSNELAIFNNLRTNDDGATVTADNTITVENLVRTHGLTYVADRDMMILTDIGAASNAGDGALVVIKSFSTVSADNTISADEQIRVAGGTSLLGNPVDVEFDAANNLIYVAERAREGGLLLGFNMAALSGGITPIYKKAFAGASAIFLDGSSEDMLQEDFEEVELRSTLVASELYPNPTTQYINLTIESEVSNTSRVDIYDANGAMIVSQNVEVLTGTNSVRIDLNDVPSGILFLRISETNTVMRFIKL